MKRFKSLNRYYKAVILIMIAMTLVFGVIYPMVISRVGYEYMDRILVPSQEKDETVYSGTIQWQQARFTVSRVKTVVFQHGDKIYGPYTAKEDPAAILKDDKHAEDMTGVELYQGDDILFRGGVLQRGNFLLLYNEDGTTASLRAFGVTSDGAVWDENGKLVDPMEPSPGTILELMGGPELTHKGVWLGWFGGVLLCILNTFTILFADELFHMHLAFQIRNAGWAEPSDLKIAGRYVSAAVLAAGALAVFLAGLG